MSFGILVKLYNLNKRKVNNMNKIDLIKRKAVDIFSEEELNKKLESGKKLTITWSRPFKTRFAFRSYCSFKSFKSISRNGT